MNALVGALSGAATAVVAAGNRQNRDLPRVRELAPLEGRGVRLDDATKLVLRMSTAVADYRLTPDEVAHRDPPSLDERFAYHEPRISSGPRLLGNRTHSVSMLRMLLAAEAWLGRCICLT